MIHDYRTQKILGVPFYEKKTYLVYQKRRYRCAVVCGKRFFEHNSFVPRYAHTTNRLYFRLYESLHSVHAQSKIASAYHISSMRIRRLLDSFHPALPALPEVLGIDEFKGNTNKTKYHCILTNLKSGRTLDNLPNLT